jgi:large subunit ribosomal protein L35
VPKMKTHKPTSKRFTRTKGGKGKLMKTKQGKSHFRRKKPRRLKAQLSDMHVVESKGLQRRISKLVPYLKKNS